MLQISHLFKWRCFEIWKKKRWFVKHPWFFASPTLAREMLILARFCIWTIFFFFSWLGRFERADIGVIPPWFCLARGVCLEILLSDFHFQGWRVRRDRRRGLLGQTEHWLESKWVRGGWGERGACSKKRFRLSGGRPWLMRNCTLSASEEPGWK